LPFEANVEFENLVFNEQKKLKKVTRYARRRIAKAKKDLEKALNNPNPRVMRHQRRLLLKHSLHIGFM